MALDDLNAQDSQAERVHTHEEDKAHVQPDLQQEVSEGVKGARQVTQSTLTSRRFRSVPVVDMGDVNADLTEPQLNPKNPNHGWDKIPSTPSS